MVIKLELDEDDPVQEEEDEDEPTPLNVRQWTHSSFNLSDFEYLYL